MKSMWRLFKNQVNVTGGCYDTPLPEQLIIYPSIQEALAAKPNAALIVTHRLLAKEEEVILENGIVFRPKSVVLGMGCNRGTSAEEIEASD